MAPWCFSSRAFSSRRAFTVSSGRSRSSCTAETFCDRDRRLHHGRRTMKLVEIFETRIEEKIDPVIKVGEVQDEAKLASEIGAYVVTPTIERYIDEFLEHYTDT